jgi:hypothetical protein
MKSFSNTTITINRFIRFFTVVLTISILGNCISKEKKKNIEKQPNFELVSILFPNKEDFKVDLSNNKIVYAKELGEPGSILDENGVSIGMFSYPIDDLKRLRKEKLYNVKRLKLDPLYKEIELLNQNQDSLNYLCFKFENNSYFSSYVNLVKMIRQQQNLNFFANIDENELLVYLLPYKQRVKKQMNTNRTLKK